MSDNAVAIHGRSMTRNYFRIGSGHRDCKRQSIQHPVERAAVRPVNVRIAERSEVIAGHQNVVVHEMNQRVAIGVSVADGNQFDNFAVHPERDLLVVGHNGKGRRGSGSSRSAIGAGIRICQPVAQLLAREDRDSHLPKVLVAAGVIRVNVRVDHVLNRAGCDLLDCGHDLIGELRVLGVHHEDAVRSGKNTDHSAGAFKCIKIGGDLRRLDFDRVKILRLLRLNNGGHQGRRCHCEKQLLHFLPAAASAFLRSSSAFSTSAFDCGAGETWTLM